MNILAIRTIAVLLSVIIIVILVVLKTVRLTYVAPLAPVAISPMTLMHPTKCFDCERADTNIGLLPYTRRSKCFDCEIIQK